VIVSAALIVLLIAAAAAVALFARWLERPLPGFAIVLGLVVAILPFPRAYVADLTPLPLDHALYTTPWISVSQGPPYNPYLNDIATQILPWAKATRLALKEGVLPLRDWWNGCGMPLAANSVSAAFSPWTILGLLLPLARGFTLLASLKILLAATGMFLWTRELGASQRAAAFGAVAFALSFSFTPPWLFFPQSAVLSLWPWTLFLVERLRDDRRRLRVLAALIAVFAIVELAGHPETAAMGFFFVTSWLALRWMCGDLPRPGPVFAGIAGAAAAALGLTAFLLIPSLYAIAASGRLAAASRPYWEPILSLAPHGPHWRSAPTALFPHTLGNGVASPALPLGSGSVPEMALGYFGIVGWSAALLLARPGSPRRRAAWVLTAILICGWGVAVGQWPFAELFARIPAIRYLFPLRFHSWVALAGAAIAALELDRYARDAASGRASPAAAVATPLALGCAATLLYFRFRPEHAAAGGLRFQTRQLTVILWVLGLAAALALFAKGRPGVFVPGLTLLCAGELLYQWRGLNRLYSPALLFPETPMVRFLREQPRPFRVVGEGPSMFPSTNVFAGVEDIRTHDATERRDYLTFLDSTCGYSSAGYFKRIGNVDAPALDFLNVRYVVAGPDATSPGPRWSLAYDGRDGRLFENARVLPRAFAPRRVRVVAAAREVSEPLSDADAPFGDAFRQIVALKTWDETAYVLAGRDEERRNAPVEIWDYRESTNAAGFRARVADGPTDGVVVMSLVQDGGWSAREESGRAVPLLRANGPFLALALTPGEHRILLRYSPPGFRAGSLISTASAASLAVWAAAAGLRGRRRGSARMT